MLYVVWGIVGMYSSRNLRSTYSRRSIVVGFSGVYTDEVGAWILLYPLANSSHELLSHNGSKFKYRTNHRCALTPDSCNALNACSVTKFASLRQLRWDCVCGVRFFRLVHVRCSDHLEREVRKGFTILSRSTSIVHRIYAITMRNKIITGFFACITASQFALGICIIASVAKALGMILCGPSSFLR